MILKDKSFSTLFCIILLSAVENEFMSHCSRNNYCEALEFKGNALLNILKCNLSLECQSKIKTSILKESRHLQKKTALQSHLE